MYIRSIFSGIILYLLCLFFSAQINELINIKTELVYLSDTEAKIVFTAAVDQGWHVYSTDWGTVVLLATFNVEKVAGATVVEKLQPKGMIICSG